MTPRAVSAADEGLLNCHSCGLLSKNVPNAHDRCPRCGAHLHLRKPDSLARTWALLIAAFLLYIPANILPVMHTASIIYEEDDTIMSGVVYLWTSGSWPLAILVFCASVTVPLAKLIALSVLAWTAQHKSTWRQQERTRLYRLVEFVGRWSMLDIFVVTLMVGLVHFQSLATISAGPGAVAFAAVVVLTMFAAMSFDPRLIWDPEQKQDD
ncbi:paraquat-inducible protein A [Silvimonas iriomotensis]|uniref:Paraquat-inducible protein n=1 Tax=Silvimonas iriomotensis TaxID=449662 RepID=A0ABQ2P571_9NEIS|nr:paraquat-inducible protein A [Silvimonas iriomotensis]GGP18414.1 paraquat-inducible protein [Silvimonas iriomotensis]